MTELTPFGWFLVGLAGYFTVVGITYGLLVAAEKRQDQAPVKPPTKFSPTTKFPRLDSAGLRAAAIEGSRQLRGDAA